MQVMKMNFKNHKEVQDMISLVVKEQGVTASEAIDSSINQQMYQRLLETGWGSIALPLWGHDDPERQWIELDKPSLEVELSYEKIKLINDVKMKEEVDMETAIGYFLLFRMEMMGYHI